MECNYPGGCDRGTPKRLTRGMCHHHYKRAVREGLIEKLKPPTLLERFERNITKDSGFPDFEDPYIRVDESAGMCWIWNNDEETQQRPRFKIGAKLHIAARVSLSLYKGWDDNPDEWVDHLCRRPRCVNPGHLEPVAPRENTMRGSGPDLNRARRGATCGKGHPMRGENVIAYRGGDRRCRTCQNEKNREWMRAYRARA